MKNWSRDDKGFVKNLYLPVFLYYNIGKKNNIWDPEETKWL